MDSELPSFLVWSLCIKCLVHHEVYSVSWSCLLSFLCNPYIPFIIYEIFYLLVIKGQLALVFKKVEIPLLLKQSMGITFLCKICCNVMTPRSVHIPAIQMSNLGRFYLFGFKSIMLNPKS